MNDDTDKIKVNTADEVDIRRSAGSLMLAEEEVDEIKKYFEAQLVDEDKFHEYLYEACLGRQPRNRCEWEEIERCGYACDD